ncbi:MAG: hypothetical protein JHC95_04720 [Solirubrobacteraceae bacterium]|nr:hypothetical protein [Solirubrobacteraceae bacterium]
MFIKAFLTLVAADAVDRHMREQQRKAWLAQQLPPTQVTRGTGSVEGVGGRHTA